MKNKSTYRKNLEKNKLEREELASKAFNWAYDLMERVIENVDIHFEGLTIKGGFVPEPFVPEGLNGEVRGEVIEPGWVVFCEGYARALFHMGTNPVGETIVNFRDQNIPFDDERLEEMLSITVIDQILQKMNMGKIIPY
jgi:hypothetical protein